MHFLFIEFERKEREAAARGGLVAKNKILLENETSEGPMVAEVTHPVRQLCKTVDGFIFVVDSSASREKGTEDEVFLLKYSLPRSRLFGALAASRTGSLPRLRVRDAASAGRCECGTLRVRDAASAGRCECPKQTAARVRGRLVEIRALVQI